MTAPARGKREGGGGEGGEGGGRGGGGRGRGGEGGGEREGRGGRGGWGSFVRPTPPHPRWRLEVSFGISSPPFISISRGCLACMLCRKA